MTDFRLEDYLDGERREIDRILTTLADDSPDVPIIVDPIRYVLDGGGKRIRPILCVAAFRAVRGGPHPAAYRLAAALEIIHTYSLIHDDLPAMDDDPVRRGRPSAHVVHGVAVATVAAAAMIPLAIRTAARAAESLGLDAATRAELVLTLCHAAGPSGMVGGQMLDLEAEGRRIELEELERIHRMKTGALLAASPLLGGIAAGADAAVRAALEVYGRALGLAFQITDDILDVTSSTGVLGKTAGRDTEMEKATFPALAGVDAARARARQEAERARAALEAADITSLELTALASYAVERDR